MGYNATYQLHNSSPILRLISFIHKHSVAGLHGIGFVTIINIKKSYKNINLGFLELIKSFFKVGVRRDKRDALIVFHAVHYIITTRNSNILVKLGT